jgi:SWIM zinc finger
MKNLRVKVLSLNKRDKHVHVSIAGIARILDISESAIKSVECWANVVFVRTRTGGRFISYAQCEADATSLRILNSSTVTYQRVSDFVFTTNKGYKVDTEAVTCECGDFLFRRQLCKHLIACMSDGVQKL